MILLTDVGVLRPRVNRDNVPPILIPSCLDLICVLHIEEFGSRATPPTGFPSLIFLAVMLLLGSGG